MKVFVYTKSGSCLSSKLWEFTFHGLNLEERIEQFMVEKGHLTCKSKTSEYKYSYLPFHEIAEIGVEE